MGGFFMAENEKIVKIRLEELGQIKEFYETALHCEAQLFLMQGRYTIDPKSLLGIYSLNLSDELTLAASGEEINLAEVFAKWIVK